MRIPAWQFVAFLLSFGALSSQQTVTLGTGQTVTVVGKQGVPGVAGIAGAAGKPGAQGVAGPMGPKGDTGPIGPSGNMGPAGANGAAGVPGAPATCSVGTTSNGVKVSVVQPTPGQCVFNFDFSGYTVSPIVPVSTPTPTPIPVTTPTGPQTWYVRPDGGTRYSSNVAQGQCDGLGDAAYPGSGFNQHCAFNDIRLLWQDGSYAYAPPDSSFPAAGWIGQGGDTYIVRGSIAAGTEPYRVGWNSNNGNGCDPAFQAQLGTDACYRGWRGNPYSGPPTPPAGTASAHTRILGENWQSCHAQSARTPVVAGFNVGSAFNFSSSYIDFQCFDISDKADCNDNVGCANQDFGIEGIGLNSNADHLTLTDVRVHGLKSFGMLGPSGDGSVFDHLDIIGNGAGGWNADAGDGKTGVGSLLVTNFNISWNGCAEEYPIVDPLPYHNCLDDSSGGYGDGFGTATVVTNGWNAVFDTGIASFNTQDGLDALHFVSNNGTSSFTVKNTQAYSNMGQQVKIGGDKGTILNSTITANCSAMQNTIPGTPAGFNKNLSDFCRASNTGAYISVNNGSTSYVTNSKFYGEGTILLQVNCTSQCDQPTTLLQSIGNLFNGYPRSDGNGNPAAYYFNDVGDVFANPGSQNSGNTFLSVKPGTFSYEDTGSVTTGTPVAVPAYGPVLP